MPQALNFTIGFVTAAGSACLLQRQGCDLGHPRRRLYPQGPSQPLGHLLLIQAGGGGMTATMTPRAAIYELHSVHSPPFTSPSHDLSRGAVAGKLMIKEGAMKPWIDCSAVGMGGKSIPGSIPEIDAMAFRCGKWREWKRKFCGVTSSLVIFGGVHAHTHP